MGTSRKLARRAAEAILPHLVPAKTATTLMAIGYRYAHYKQFRESNAYPATATFTGKYGFRVRRGPFTGMLLPERIALRRYSIQKLLGCYEQELHPILCECLSDKTYNRAVDVGSAEGYYATGLALTLKKPVFAYEINPFERYSTKLTAEANDVQKGVALRGWCSPDQLERLCRDRSLIISDCEGFEGALFTNSLARALSHSDLIIEVHNGPAWAPTGRRSEPQVSVGQMRDLLIDRFSASHQAQTVRCTVRRAEDFPELLELDLARNELVDEARNNGLNDQEWIYFKARNP